MKTRRGGTRSSPHHGPANPAAGGASTPRGRGENPPPVANVLPRSASPAITIGVASATPARRRASPRRSVAMQSLQVESASTCEYGPSVADGDQSPARVGGSLMPPPSPAKPVRRRCRNSYVKITSKNQ
eukprot:CAMPEP_0113598376 /NCGR_PEP_ID=MMETSP0015_2-20120614/41548_1 /TAXON_ID=2838 /ORGANISM="Odontella" /LENGTH=128 /DNA_ID=CAMNT_0000506377 /DNA_START=75 /DNA_END=461 /DNA_ORIENTATION=- /assembly_acc=CAM_ASM_000160